MSDLNEPSLGAGANQGGLKAAALQCCAGSTAQGQRGDVDISAFSTDEAPLVTKSPLPKEAA